MDLNSAAVKVASGLIMIESMVLAQCPPVQQARLLPIEPATTGPYGALMAISGSWLVIGTPSDDGGGMDAGSAQMYRLDGSEWTFHSELSAHDAAAGDRFGSAVSISGDRIVIGAPFDDTAAGADAGSAYAFRFDESSSMWLPDNKFTINPAAPNHQLGRVVAISGDRIALGKAFDPIYGARIVHVFEWNPITLSWDEPPFVWSPPTASARFGDAIAMSGDWMIVGAPFAETGELTDAGLAYVYHYSDDISAWQLNATLTASDATSEDHFGQSVGISGERAIVGAPRADAGNANGAVYLFHRAGGSWTEHSRLVPPTTGLFQGPFGESVAIWGDQIALGAPTYRTSDALFLGAAYRYRWNGVTSTWQAGETVTAADGASYDSFGTAVSLAGDFIVVAATGVDAGDALDVGAVYVYSSFLPGDADRSGVVNFADVASVMSTFGNLYAPDSGSGDADGDGRVDFGDIASILVNYGADCP